MGKIKVGDRVRALTDGLYPNGTIVVGNVYEVLSTTHTGVRVKAGGYEEGLTMYYNEVELVKTKEEPHSHYFIDVGEFFDKDTGKCLIDVYVILEKFKDISPAMQHVVKKALATGKRGHKDYGKDLQDIIDTAEREKVIDSKRG